MVEGTGASWPSAISQEQLSEELVQLVRREIGAVADLKQIAVVEALPKARQDRPAAHSPAPQHGLQRLQHGRILDGRGHRRVLASEELVQLVRREIGAVADLKQIAVVEALPKTRSGNRPRRSRRTRPPRGAGPGPARAHRWRAGGRRR
jgi:hypothetical protein